MEKMETKNKVIFLIPTYNNATFLRDCLGKLIELYPQPDLYVFLENNSTDDTLQVIQDFKGPKKLIRLWFKEDLIEKAGNPYEGIGIARQVLLEYARKLNPNYAIFIDDDIVIYPPDFVTQITRRHKDVIGAPYLRRYPEGTFLASKWKRKGKDKLWFKSKCKGLQKVYVTSAGCICLSRRIIQDKRVNFHPVIWTEKLKASEDFSYCIRAHHAGYDVWLDGDINGIGHYAEIDKDKPWMVTRDAHGNVNGHIKFKY
jgi:glycosyltransferase involved in cell wall biosynthesis